MAASKSTRNDRTGTAREIDRRRRLPVRTDYAVRSWKDLPFVRESRSTHSKWTVPLAGDYESACLVGQEFAAHFALLMKSNPDRGGGLLRLIARDMNFADESEAKGYIVGFFEQLERFVRIGASEADPYDDVDAVRARFAALEAIDKAAA